MEERGGMLLSLISFGSFLGHEFRKEGGVHLQPKELGEGRGKVCHVQVLHDTLGWNVFKVLGSHGHRRKVASGKRP